MTAPRKTTAARKTARPQPRDRKPKKTAQQREAEQEGLVEIDWRGHHLVIDIDPKHMTGATMLAFEEDRIVTALAGMLGDSWAEVSGHTVEELGELFELMGNAVGFEPGESEPSSA